MARTTLALNLFFAWAYGNRNLWESVARVSDLGSAGNTVVSSSGHVSVEKASLADEGKAEEFPFFAKAEELLQQALNEKADKSELIAKLEETKKALGERMSAQSTELQQQLDGKASELSEEIKSSAAELNTRIDTINGDEQKLDQKIEGVQMKLDTAHSELAGQITGVQTNAETTKKELEEKIASAEADVLQSSEKRLVAATEDLQGKIDAVTASVTGAKTELGSKIDNLEAKMKEDEVKASESVKARFEELDEDIKAVEKMMFRSVEQEALTRQALRRDMAANAEARRARRKAKRTTTAAEDAPSPGTPGSEADGDDDVDVHE